MKNYTNDEIISWCERREGTPLHAAAALSNSNEIDALIGADKALLRSKDAEASTPLHFACATGTPETISQLLEHGADINARNTQNETPLFWIMFERDDSKRREKLHTLLKSGADVNTQTVQDESIMHYAFRMPELVEILIEHGADLSLNNSSGWTPLHLSALFDDHIKTTELLLQASANPNKTDREGLTPLHQAARHNGTHTIKLLVDAGADLETRDISGYTPLHQAVIMDKYDNAKALLELGADVHTQDNKKVSLLDLAENLNLSYDMIQLLEEYAQMAQS